MTRMLKDILEIAKKEIQEEKLDEAKKEIKQLLREIGECEDILIKLRKQLNAKLQEEVATIDEYSICLDTV